MDYVRWSAEAPARAWGLWPLKGRIAVGAHADIVLIDMNRRAKLHQGRLQSISRISPWHGRTVVGTPLHTIVRGRFVMRDGQLVTDAEGWGTSVKPIQNMPPASPRHVDTTTRAIRTAPLDAPPSARPNDGAQDMLWSDESYLHPLPVTGT